MNKRDRENILANLERLVEGTDTPSFKNIFRTLKAEQHFSDFMISKIENGHNEEDRKRIFYSMIPTRGPRIFDDLVKALLGADLRDLAILLKGRGIIAEEGCTSSKVHNNNNNSDKVDNYTNNLVCGALPDVTVHTNIERYKLTSKPKGYVLIINIDEFEYDWKSRREGSVKDYNELKSLWTRLGFNVISKKNLRKYQFEKEIKNFVSMDEFGSVDSAFLFVMSHGDCEGDQTIVYTYGVEETITSKWIIEQFQSSSAPLIANKPKVIFFQTCRGPVRDYGTLVDVLSLESVKITNGKDLLKVVTDSSVGPVPSLYNLLVVYPTRLGYVSQRDTLLGSWFIQELLSVIKRRAKVADLREIIDEVDRNLQEKTRNLLEYQVSFQVLNVHSHGFNRKLYLEDATQCHLDTAS